MLGIRCLSISLSLSLVLITGSVIGGLSISTGNEATDQTKEAGQRGLDATITVCTDGFSRLQKAGNDGLKASFDSGRENAEYLAGLLMDQIIVLLNSKLHALIDAPWMKLKQSYEFIRLLPRKYLFDEITQRDILGPLFKADFLEMRKRSVTLQSFSASDNLKNGFQRSFHRYHIETPDTVPNKPLTEGGFHSYVYAGSPDVFCDGVTTEAECTAKTCVWCTSPTGAPVCGHPQRKINGNNAPCPTGYSPPAGYQLPWFATAQLSLFFGSSDEMGNAYVGSCGNDLECGCAAWNDYQDKMSPTLDLDIIGQYRRPDGTFPPRNSTPASVLREPGVCSLPQQLSRFAGAGAASRSYVYPTNQVHWVPLGQDSTTPILSLSMYIQTRFSTGETAEITSSIDVDAMSSFMRDIAKQAPPETRIYAVQTDHWMTEAVCKDDFVNLVSIAGLTCPLLKTILGSVATGDPCEADLSLLSPSISSGVYMWTHCAETCGFCDSGEFRRRATGALMGSTHNTSFVPLPLNISSYGSRGLPDKFARHVNDSDDSVIVQNAAWIQSEVGGYRNLQPNHQYNFVDNGGRLWWMKVFHYSRTENTATGITFHVVLLVLRDEAMKSIDVASAQVEAAVRADIDAANEAFQTSNRIVSENIAKDNKKTEDDKERGFLIMYIVVAVCVCVLMVVSVVFVHLIIAPLIVLEGEMAEVALMHLESVDSERPLSALGEVARMQSSFLQMVRNLIEYRNYMPQSILCEDEEEEEEEESATDAMTSRCSTAIEQTPQARGSTQRKSLRSMRSMMSSRQSMLSRVDEAKGKFEKDSDGIKKKPVSFLVFTTRGWHSSMDGQSEVSTCTHHGALLSKNLAIFTQTKGIPDTFCGDRLLCSFNAIKPNRMHKSLAVKAGVLCSQASNEYAQQHMSGKTSASWAAVSGDVRCGNIGCPGMKRFTFFGATNTWAYALERVNVWLGTKGLIDKWILSEAATGHDMRLIHAVAFKKRSSHVLNVWEVLREKVVSEDEWMYQLEEGEKQNPYRLWDQYAQCCISHDAETGTALETQLEAEILPDPIPDQVRVGLSEMLSGTGASADGLELRFH
eukprot:TRINITY_DN6415_c0_g1_i2.p1 TRINITY_DN6415_c0_g1~~TRINITY_DN6415_c0_g1_i2.p1  ORF type:complete len:1084 (+),score=197.58 TRINITY_DN6415_c0_g1_i2:264-3515(+)